MDNVLGSSITSDFNIVKNDIEAIVKRYIFRYPIYSEATNNCQMISREIINQLEGGNCSDLPRDDVSDMAISGAYHGGILAGLYFCNVM